MPQICLNCFISPNLYQIRCIRSIEISKTSFRSQKCLFLVLPPVDKVVTMATIINYFEKLLSEKVDKRKILKLTKFCPQMLSGSKVIDKKSAAWWIPPPPLVRIGLKLSYIG